MKKKSQMEKEEEEQNGAWKLKSTEESETEEKETIESYKFRCQGRCLTGGVFDR